MGVSLHSRIASVVSLVEFCIQVDSALSDDLQCWSVF